MGAISKLINIYGAVTQMQRQSALDKLREEERRKKKRDEEVAGKKPFGE